MRSLIIILVLGIGMAAGAIETGKKFNLSEKIKKGNKVNVNNIFSNINDKMLTTCLNNGFYSYRIIKESLTIDKDYYIINTNFYCLDKMKEH